MSHGPGLTSSTCLPWTIKSNSSTINNVMWCVQDFLRRYFPDGEVFASLTSYLLQSSAWCQPLEEFHSKHFKLYNIGIQIRRKKCGADETELLCKYEPTVVEYCQV